MEYNPPGPVGRAFMLSNAFIRGLRGPLGSGKSTCCIMDMWQTAKMQHTQPDGWKRYRSVITRNTYSELETTTLRSFLTWFPQHLGKLTYGAPIEYKFRRELGDGVKLEAEFWFLALDRPDHIRKLLSLEVTQAFMNEAREQPKAILDGMTGRVGRYPAKKDGGAVRSGIIMDTNSPDASHWWAKMSDYATPEVIADTAKLERELRGMGALPDDQKLLEFFTQPSAELRDGSMNPEAENIDNLETGYYVRLKAGKSDDWIKVYIRNEYHFVIDGKAIYDQYRDNLHVQECEFNPNWPIHIGMDFGLTPAAVFGQRAPSGQTRILSELIATRLGAKSFAREVKEHLALHYAGCTLGTVTGDPSGNAGGNDDVSVFQLMASEGLIALPARTNDPDIRIAAVNTPLAQLIDGIPALVISPRCLGLRAACAGGYQYRRVQIASEVRYELKPNKNMHSHVAEALQYLQLGLGIGRDVIRRPASMTANRPAFANMDYDMFDR